MFCFNYVNYKMSVPKGKRSKSKVEFEMIYFRLADGIDTLTENYFFAEPNLLAQHKAFIKLRSRNLQELTDSLVYYIKIANSIYPQCMLEMEERRVAMDKAIGVCYAILTNFQRVMMRLRIKDNRYTNDVKNVVQMINSLKAWRKSDNKLKAVLEENTANKAA